MSREADPKEWLRYAESDRRVARHLLEAGDYEACAFHCQQAVENCSRPSSSDKPASVPGIRMK